MASRAWPIVNGPRLQNLDARHLLLIPHSSASVPLEICKTLRRHFKDGFTEDRHKGLPFYREDSTFGRSSIRSTLPAAQGVTGSASEGD